jgi:hypothetical protein
MPRKKKRRRASEGRGGMPGPPKAQGGKAHKKAKSNEAKRKALVKANKQKKILARMKELRPTVQSSRGRSRSYAEACCVLLFVLNFFIAACDKFEEIPEWSTYWLW